MDYKSNILEIGQQIYLEDALTVDKLTNNVGIGTTSPATKLQISDSTNPIITIERVDATVTDNELIGRINFKSTDSNDSNSNAYINAIREISAVSQVPMAMTFGTGVLGTVGERLRITSVGDVLVSTTTVQNSAANRGNITIGGTSSSILSFGWGATNKGYLFHDGNLTLMNQMSNNLVFGTAGSERMRIDASGNVGIGTTTPAQKLDVAGTVRTTGTLGSSSGSYSIDHQGVNTWKIGITATNTSTFHIGNDTGGAFVNKILNITSAGNVGIGTTSPTEKLHVVGNGLFTGGVYVNNTSAFLWNTTNGAIRFGTNNTERARIDAAGNIGIGTTSPVANLHVNSSTTESVLQLTTSTSGALISDGLRIAMIGNVAAFLLRESADMWFATSNTERLRITAAGDVGIGTTSPSAKLHVIGNATVSATLSTANAKITGTLTDSFNQVGTAGQVLSSTGTGIEWITGGGGGGGSTIIVKDEGTTVGSSFTTLDFYGSNIQAGASGSTAVITALNNAGTGSVYSNDTTAQYAPTASFANVEINTVTVEATAPDTAGTGQKLIATITFGVDNVSDVDGFNNFDFRLYNSSASSAIADTTHSWCSYMSKGEFEKRTVFTFHIPLYDGVGGSDTIIVQAKQSTAYTPEIYYCALTLMEGTN